MSVGIKMVETFADYAARKGKKIISVPLKDKSSAKMMWDDKLVDVVQVRNGRALRGIRKGATEENIAAIIDKLQSLAAEGVNVLDMWAKELAKNIKK